LPSQESPTILRSLECIKRTLPDGRLQEIWIRMLPANQSFGVRRASSQSLQPLVFSPINGFKPELLLLLTDLSSSKLSSLTLTTQLKVSSKYSSISRENPLRFFLMISYQSIRPPILPSAWIKQSRVPGGQLSSRRHSPNTTATMSSSMVATMLKL